MGRGVKIRTGWLGMEGCVVRKQMTRGNLRSREYGQNEKGYEGDDGGELGESMYN